MTPNANTRSPVYYLFGVAWLHTDFLNKQTDRQTERLCVCVCVNLPGFPQSPPEQPQSPAQCSPGPHRVPKDHPEPTQSRPRAPRVPPSLAVTHTHTHTAPRAPQCPQSPAQCPPGPPRAHPEPHPELPEPTQSPPRAPPKPPRPSCSTLGELESPNDPLEPHTYYTVRVEMRALWRVSEAKGARACAQTLPQARAKLV